jgi:hypothetical protein
VGQVDTPVLFLGRAGGATAYVTPSEIVLPSLRLHFPGSHSHPAVEGAEPLPGKTNYLRGAVTVTGVSQFGRIRYKELYPGIDLELYGGEEELEYDFVVSP